MGAMNIGGPQLHTEAILICVSTELTTVMCCSLMECLMCKVSYYTPGQNGV